VPLQVRRHAAAHDAQADESDFHFDFRLRSAGAKADRRDRQIGVSKSFVFISLFRISLLYVRISLFRDAFLLRNSKRLKRRGSRRASYA